MFLVTKTGALRHRRTSQRMFILFVLSFATMLNSAHSQQSRGGIFSLGISDDAKVACAWRANLEPDLAGYKLYIGTVSGVSSTCIDVGRRTSFEVTGLIRGMTYYFALTAYNDAGIESDRTPELVSQIPLFPPIVQASQDLHEIIDSPPAISSIPDQTVSKNRASGPIPLFVSDAETAAADLQVTVHSSNPLVVPLSGVIVAGSDEGRTLVIDPVNGETGFSLVTVAVSDGSSITTISFLVAVGQNDQ